MTTLGKNNYLKRRTCGPKGSAKRKDEVYKHNFRYWWLPKFANSGKLTFSVGEIILPEKMAGKRVLLKLECLDDNHKELV